MANSRPQPKPLYFCSDHWFVLEAREAFFFNIIYVICNNDHCAYQVRLGRSYRRRWWRGE
jgi:hypothetical protein